MSLSQPEQRFVVKVVQKLETSNNPFIHPYTFGDRLQFITDKSQLTNLTISQSRSHSGDEIFSFEIEVFFEYFLSNKRAQAFSNQLITGNPIDPFSEKCPGTIKSFVDENKDIWINEGENLLKLVRWRYNSTFDLSGIKEKVYLTLDEINWTEIHTRPSGLVLTGAWMSEEIDVNQEIQKLLDSKISEPLYADILIEAKSQSSAAKRSAYILAVAALEIGVKQIIIKFKPDTSWLLDNIQSPPIEKLLREYLPQIAGGIVLSEETLKEVRNIVSDRNVMSHKGSFNLSFIQFHERINLINDLLRLFDKLSGNKWAEKYIVEKRTL
ncbi:hypothetical protein [Spirosoma rigui]|uniref:hypothetical protein n=1 Tax=Spirosoma rigui TaxID=564064 RepID=UPI0009B0F417|nr:hypothetical protein [Spirosoma rigui]